MQTTKTVLFDGKKTSPVTIGGDVGWDVLGENPSDETLEKLYSTVAWLYRCVTIRGNSVASMPFTVKRGEKVVYEFDGLTPQNEPPKEISWITELPSMLGMVEVANVLGGRAYFEKRSNVLGTRAIQFDWFLPWSVSPIYNGVPNKHGSELDPTRSLGDLLGFWREFNQASVFRPIRFDPDEIIYFWLPDYATEIGPAINYPGKAVLQNAGVVKSLDIFLWGYFKRGLVKATLLKYKDAVTKEEAERVKEWFNRVLQGVKNAFATNVVRGDFETMIIGDGVKELRDNQLTKDEKDSISVGLGIPPSKLLPVGVNRATKDGDDRSYIEDTIIPEINWIYAVVNKQMLNGSGYSIIANPQTLRVMQSDEVERSQAFRNYLGDGESTGYTLKEAESILGIHVPQDLRDEVIQDQLDILGADPLGEEKTLLNGIQIEAALGIIDAFGEGKVTRENAINMYDAFLGINPDVARILIPESVEKPIGTDVKEVAQRQAVEDLEIEEDEEAEKSIGLIQMLDKREERNRFLRWLDNRGADTDIKKYETDILTPSEKNIIYDEWHATTHMDELIGEFANSMKDNKNE